MDFDNLFIALFANGGTVNTIKSQMGFMRGRKGLFISMLKIF